MAECKPLWKKPYHLAIIEVNPAKLNARIEKAEVAIRTRMDELGACDSPELNELQEALKGLRFKAAMMPPTSKVPHVQHVSRDWFKQNVFHRFAHCIPRSISVSLWDELKQYAPFTFELYRLQNGTRDMDGVWAVSQGLLVHEVEVHKAEDNKSDKYVELYELPKTEKARAS